MGIQRTLEIVEMSRLEESITIRPVHPVDFPVIAKWMQKNTWPANEDILAIYMAQDPDGFLVAEHKTKGVIGCITFIKLDVSTTQIGLFLVDKELRGKGIGRLLWNTGYERNKESALCLSSSPHLVEHYRSKGFIKIGLHTQEYIGVP